MTVPAGLQVETFADDDFKGTRHVYGQGDHKLKANDKLSSMNVTAAGAHVCEAMQCVFV